MSVAVASSPVFSPSRVAASITCKKSPETMSLARLDGSPSSSATSSSPFLSRLQRMTAFRPARDASPSPSMAVEVGSLKGASLLKRKRPARIDIPGVTEPGFFAAAPASDGRREVEEDGERFSVFCKRGRKRLEMEDRYAASSHLRGEQQLAFFGIFDGHGGSKAAEFAAANLGKNIEREVGMHRDEEERKTVEAVRAAYLQTDAEFMKQESRGGACCVTAIIQNNNLIVSNAGDCRAVVCRNGVAEALTLDHRPSRIDEKDRIEDLGGYVDCCSGVWRLQGCLAVSRGIGDAHLKQWVTSEPETTVLNLTQDHEFLILASDGLWDKVSNQEAVDVVRRGGDSAGLSPLSACRKLSELSAVRGSMDDISVMVVQLRDFLRR